MTQHSPNEVAPSHGENFLGRVYKGEFQLQRKRHHAVQFDKFTMSLAINPFGGASGFGFRYIEENFTF